MNDLLDRYYAEDKEMYELQTKMQLALRLGYKRELGAYTGRDPGGAAVGAGCHRMTNGGLATPDRVARFAISQNIYEEVMKQRLKVAMPARAASPWHRDVHAGFSA